MTSLKDIVGQRFARLKVIEFAGRKDGHALWLCVCDCGEEHTVKGFRLRSGNAKSCGCLKSELGRKKVGVVNAAFKHGMFGTPEYVAYYGAKQRCTNPKGTSYKDYGGSGIKFLFTSFEQWFAELGPKPTPKHSGDRFPNNEGNYEPGNVRWATAKEQRENQRPRQRKAA
jgi:hypothetical protein